MKIIMVDALLHLTGSSSQVMWRQQHCSVPALPSRRPGQERKHLGVLLAHCSQLKYAKVLAQTRLAVHCLASWCAEPVLEGRQLHAGKVLILLELRLVAQEAQVES